MADILRDPIWQGVGAIITLILGVIGFYYAGKNKVWLIIAGAVIILIAGFALGIQSQTNNTDSNILTIEQLPYNIYPFDGQSDEDPACCFGRAYLQIDNSSPKDLAYGLNYFLDGDATKFGYAGFAFVFTTSQNLSTYESIRFTIIFGDQSNKADINFQDITKLKVPYHITGNGQSENKFIVPLSQFGKIDLKAIRSIGFQVDSSVANGNHTFYVKDIQLIKK
jgi:hypothetical protein